MTEYGVRRAIGRDLPWLGRLFDLSLRAECRRDGRLAALGGDWNPFLRMALRSKDLLLLVLEVDGRPEGYCLASQQVVRGPSGPSPWYRRLLGRPRPRPLLAPFRLITVEDIYLTRAGRRGDGARALARGVREWAVHLKAGRIAGSVSLGNTPAEAFATFLGMRPLRTLFAVDPGPGERWPDVPQPRS